MAEKIYAATISSIGSGNGEQTLLLLDIHPVLYVKVSLQATGLLNWALLGKEEGEALLAAYNALGRDGSIASIGSVHYDLGVVVKQLESAGHEEAAKYRARMDAIETYASEMHIAIREPGED